MITHGRFQMPPLALSDDQLDMLDRVAEPISPAHRWAFVEAVKARLSSLSSDGIGPGSLHRVAAEEQRIA